MVGAVIVQAGADVAEGDLLGSVSSLLGGATYRDPGASGQRTAVHHQQSRRQGTTACCWVLALPAAPTGGTRQKD